MTFAPNQSEQPNSINFQVTRGRVSKLILLISFCISSSVFADGIDKGRALHLLHVSEYLRSELLKSECSKLFPDNYKQYLRSSLSSRISKISKELSPSERKEYEGLVRGKEFQDSLLRLKKSFITDLISDNGDGLSFDFRCGRSFQRVDGLKNDAFLAYSP